MLSCQTWADWDQRVALQASPVVVARHTAAWVVAWPQVASCLLVGSQALGQALLGV